MTKVHTNTTKSQRNPSLASQDGLCQNLALEGSRSRAMEMLKVIPWNIVPRVETNSSRLISFADL